MESEGTPVGWTGKEGWGEMMEIVLLGLGVGAGYLFCLLDCVLYAVYLHPEDETSRHLNAQLKMRRYWLALRMTMQMNRAPKRYIHKSLKFLAAFVMMGIFVVTSTTSAFAHGLIFGFGLYTVAELLRDYKNPTLMRQTFFWDLAAAAQDQTIRTLANLFIVSMLLLLGLALL